MSARRTARLLALAVPCALLAAQADSAPVPRLASDVTWRVAIGGIAAEKDTVLLLMCRGFLRARTSADFDKKRDAWLAAHPKAVVREVQVVADEKARLVFVWVVDGKDNLAVHLVREGCMTAGVLRTIPDQKLLVPDADIAAVRDEANAAENAARERSLGVWAEILAGEAMKRGDELREEGKHAAALAEYEKALKAGATGEELWCQIAGCRDRVGDYAGALQAWDNAIGDGHRWPPISDKALCIANHEGEVKALEWLRGEARRRLDEPTGHRLVGEFLATRQKVAPAIVEYQRCVELLVERYGFRFGPDDWLVLDDATLAHGNNDFADVWSPLQELAKLQLQSGDAEAAFRYATMSVAVGQQCNRCKGYYSEAEIEAGDVDCRLVRARVFMDREKWREAAAEIAHAKTLADRGSYIGHKNAVSRASRELERRRPAADAK